MGNGKQIKHITLKEAATISGYSSDYLGQLIRNGKLQGEQIFSNVAWVTTEEAVFAYLENGKKKNNKRNSKSCNVAGQHKKIFLELPWQKIYRWILYVIIILTVCFLMFLFYIFSVGVEKYLSQKALDKQESTISIE